MVTEEQLTALDLTIWLGSTERAADVDFSTQSTISRRNNKVLKRFGIHLQRINAELLVSGELQLLNLERQVHQLARIKRQRGLRLQAPFWLQHGPGIALPEGWKMNARRANLSCTSPVNLLREHVLDACLATPTQLPDDRDDLFILELHQRPIELTLLQRTEESEGDLKDGFRSSLEIGNLELQLMPFLPSSCCERSQQWFEELLKLSNPDEQAGTAPGPTSHPGKSFPMAYLTPEMRMAQPMACQVYEDFEPYTYTEHLIVLKQHANEPAIQALIESLQNQIGN